MENSGSIITLVIFAALAGFLSYRINQERNKLREVFMVFEHADDPLVGALDELLLSGKLQPVTA